MIATKSLTWQSSKTHKLLVGVEISEAKIVPTFEIKCWPLRITPDEGAEMVEALTAALAWVEQAKQLTPTLTHVT